MPRNSHAEDTPGLHARSAAGPRLVVGTAGHIDHGKSRLVLALTGIDPDRLPEEQARGMTIDLGFAHTRCEGADIYFVDVPGHERFLRNMLAGATGLDAALLVVAADDGVMPQTHEHAEVLALLGVRCCVLVLSKCDLVDSAWAGQVAEDARSLLERLGLALVATVFTSAQTGTGLEELRRVLAQLACSARPPADACDTAAPGWFRMPIDRAFTVAGRGTVVTGTVLHGAISTGEEVELWPAGRRVRVRDLQTHGAACETSAGRLRLAINLPGVSCEEAGRGCELAAPGYLLATRCCDVLVRTLRIPGETRRTRLRVRIHTATCEVLAELRLAAHRAAGSEASADPFQAGAAFAQLLLAAPIVAEGGQAFIVRDESGQRTLGGGCIVQPLSRPWTARRPPQLEALAALVNEPPRERVSPWLRLTTWQMHTPARIAAALNLPDAEATVVALDRLAEAGRAIALEAGGQRLWLDRQVYEAVLADVRQRLNAFLKSQPRSPGVPRREWPAWMPRVCPERFRPALAESLLGPQRCHEAGGHVLPEPPPSAGSDLPPEDAALYRTLLNELAEGGFQPPGIEALRCRTDRNERRLRELVRLAAARGELVTVAAGFWLHAERWEELKGKLAAALAVAEGLTVAEIRTLLRSTRKYVVPLCEFLDAQGLTRRDGDLRRAGPRLAQRPVQE